MTSHIYCKYCHHNWKSRIEYDKHIRCCEYFYQQRRNPPQPEMDERGTPIPNLRQMYRYIQELTYRLEKTETELNKLKTVVNRRQKKVILTWLNQPNQTPKITFEEWWRGIKATENDVTNVVNGNLTYGIELCLDSAIRKRKGEDAVLPIRCFSQKPNTFYVYSCYENETPSWRIMINNDPFMQMVNYISKSISREYREGKTLKESQPQTEKSEEFMTRYMDKDTIMLSKINGGGVDPDKRLSEIKKKLFSILEENLRVGMDCEFE